MKLKLKGKILLLALIPLAVLGISLGGFTSLNVRNTIQDMSKQQLKVAAHSALKTYDMINKEDYTVLSNGKLGKGYKFVVSNYSEEIDYLKQNTNIEYTFFYGKDIVSTTMKDDRGNRLLGFEAEDEAIIAVLTNNEEYFSTHTLIGDKEYYGYYIPIKQPSTQAVVGMFFAGIPKADMDSSILTVIIGNVTSTSIVIIIAILLILISMSMIIKSLRRSVVNLELVSKGILNSKLDSKDLKRKDEIGDIARATEDVRNSIKGIVQNITDTTSTLIDFASDLREKSNKSSNMTKEVEKTVEEVAQSSTNQAENTQSAAESVMVIGEMVEKSVINVKELYKNCENMSRLRNEVLDILDNLSDANERTKNAINTISAKTQNTNNSVEHIKKATELITEIASETTLLALNANIEAARAGEHGKGFAVVASQIQELANQSTESAKKIEMIIKDLIINSNDTVETMKKVEDIIEVQNNNVHKTKDTFNVFNEGINITNQSVKEISDNVGTLDNSRKEIVEDIQILTSIAEENAASTEETAGISAELNKIMNDVYESANKVNEISDKLSNEINIFTI
ncbi:methyl-accepting chemotaxis protein [Clostridium neonatale]|uniref:methyl-accepting chemotaxis protein n=1 Tax=Clostridium neonatale TaxID=137838 RepID=UPI001DD6CA44|nr:methyl-accepting chemotaxis protein [Clostridium neonatale]CAG9709820.1 Putative methyl-accepting chemotaxis protein (MCP) [Clostridium neonatale]